MTFFNKKEEILEIKLTSYGKQKLASGNFKPTYYAFFDDDILYDGARAGFSEDNNDIEPRIQENSPSLRVQTSFTDLENRVRRHNSLDTNSYIFEDYDGLRNILPLGNSQLGNQNVASWRVENLSTTFNTVRATINNDLDNKPLLNIPQLDMDMVVQPSKVEKDFVGVIDPKTKKFILEKDGYFIRIEGDYVVFDISENNVDLLNDSFSLEVYEVLSENSEEVLSPKPFKKRVEKIVDGILLDDDEVEAQVNLAKVDERFVEYYFDIAVDNNIDEQIKTETINRRVKKGSIFDKAYTPESVEQLPGERLYTTDNNGEDC